MSKICFSTGNHPYYHEDNGDYDQDYEYDPDIICADYLEPEVQIENVEDDDENNEVELFWISERMRCQESAIFFNKK